MNTDDAVAADIARRLEGLKVYVWRLSGHSAVQQRTGMVQAPNMDDAWCHVTEHLRANGFYWACTVQLHEYEPGADIGIVNCTDERSYDYP